MQLARYGLSQAALVVILVSLSSSPVRAQATVEIIDGILATDVSADGSVIAGNTPGAYETARWTAADGVVPLGLATVPVIGVGAGTPDVSSDGTKISATILSDDGLYATQGIWTLGSGWQQCIPPTLPDGGILDSSYGSAWGLSGDGNTLVGLYWRPGQPGGSAHPSSWTQAGGLVDLGTQSSGTCETCGSGRANAANSDGSVIAGWIENPDFGNWWPTVWVNGVRTVLRETEGFAEASGVSPDGSIVLGSSWFPPVGQFSVEEAAAWRWDGSQWIEQRIGKLPGTSAPFGSVQAYSISADGSMIVGYNRFNGSSDTGFVWTQATGIISAEQYLASQGVTLTSLDIATLSAISDDGSVIVGIGYDVRPPYPPKSFRINRCVLRGDINKDTYVNGLDVEGFVRAKMGLPPLAGENPVCANYGGTLEQDIAAFMADLLGT